jgi:DNA repair protein RecN (Recombination protein N)
LLQQLEIHNVALIDRVGIELGNGLNVLTGETGAGKSIIIDSINAILGERLSKDLIRTGKEKAVVEAVFQIDNEKLRDIFEESGIEPEEDGTLIISREFSLSGKNTCRINGKMVTVSMLKDIGGRLVDIHGQHDNQSLLRTESHINLLDSFGGEKINSLKNKYLKLLNEYKEIRSKLRSITGDQNDRERKIDLLKYQIEEIRNAGLKPGEDEELNRQRTILTNSEKIVASLSRAYESLFSGNNIKSSAYDSINDAVSDLSGIVKLDDGYAEIVKKLEEVSYQIDDIIDAIRKEKDKVEYNPDLLEQIEDRVDLIFKLKKKYGSSIEDINKYLAKIEQELDEIVKSEEIIAGLEEKLNKITKELYLVCVELNKARNEAANILEGKIGTELEDLEMKRAKFKVNIEFCEDNEGACEYKFTANGLDKVEFLISPNIGEPLKPLSKIASGGEMSRIMLAIKTILADVDEMPTLIFDEIDIGISGKAAQKVGEKLSYISKGHQVICVTHLAQIACMADRHYLIEKEAADGFTKTNVKKLEGTEIKNEVARILGGANISNITLKHAEEMLKIASKLKL